jgi:hypothetical protein
LPKRNINANVEKSPQSQGNAMKKRRITEVSMEELAVLAAQAGREAVERVRKAGLPVTGTEGGKIVKTFPDGRKVVLKDLRKSSESEKASA